MTSPAFNLILSILIPTGTGYALLHLLFRKQSLPFSMKIALSYGLGLGTLAIWMLCLYVLQQPFNLVVLRFPLIAIILFALLIYLKDTKSSMTTEKRLLLQAQKELPRHGAERILHIIFIVILSAYLAHTVFHVLWQSMAWPISSWDAIATVAFKAKIFFFEQSPPPLELLPHRTYPLFTPFMESWIAFNLGYWDDQLVKIIFLCAFLSYLAVQYKFLSYLTNRTWALLGCTILLSSNFFTYHATISYRDFFLMYFNCITIMLLLIWNKNKVSGFLILASLFAGFNTFTKLEGTAFLAIYFFLFSILNFPTKLFSKREKLVNAAKFFIPCIAISLIFHIYKIYHHVLKEGVGTSDKTAIDLSWEKFSLIPQIIIKFLNNLLLTGNWNIIWFLAFLSLIHLRKKWNNAEVKLILLSLILFFGLYIGVAVCTTNYIWIAGEKAFTTLSRLILHFFPLSVLLIILLNYPDAPGELKS